MIVLDASAAVELLLGTPNGARVAARIHRPGETLHAPHLLDVEVASALRRLHAAGDLTAVRGRQALEDLDALLLTRYAHDLFLPRIWVLRANVTPYDAAYVALAEVLDAPLLTLDRRLAGAAGHRARVELIASVPPAA